MRVRIISLKDSFIDQLKKAQVQVDLISPSMLDILNFSENVMAYSGQTDLTKCLQALADHQFIDLVMLLNHFRIEHSNVNIYRSIVDRLIQKRCLDCFLSSSRLNDIDTNLIPVPISFAIKEVDSDDES